MTSESTRPSKLSSVGNALAVAGMGALCLGWRGSALTLFGTGYRLLERDWRRRHPHFAGGFAARLRQALAFYRQRHENPMNRRLHQLGVPLILGGAAGLCLSKPLSGSLWALSFGSFASGWALNLVGH
ncbi:MAG TPA: Mpo1-like protein, partial [Polyangiaceae bacterium]|nr:Mpo1-like protein [Polyangiaceae bacterium]